MHHAKIGMFFATITALVCGAGYLLAGAGGGVLALLAAIGLNFSLYRWSEVTVRRLHGADEVAEEEAPESFVILRALASRAGIPVPRLYTVDTPTPNAFAIGRRPQHAALVVTTGLLNCLDRDELASVIAHELAHIKHCDTPIMTMTAALAGMLTRAAMSLMPPWSLGAAPPVGKAGVRRAMDMLARLVVVPLAACTRVFVSPLREFEADESSAWLTGDPLALAEALRKLEGYHQASPLPVGSLAMAHLYTVNPSVLIRWAYGCKTHPSTVDRMLYLEAIAQMRDAAAWSDDMNF